jgi:hypothetical protein
MTLYYTRLSLHPRSNDLHFPPWHGRQKFSAITLVGYARVENNYDAFVGFTTNQPTKADQATPFLLFLEKISNILTAEQVALPIKAAGYLLRKTVHTTLM